MNYKFVIHIYTYYGITAIYFIYYFIHHFIIIIIIDHKEVEQWLIEDFPSDIDTDIEMSDDESLCSNMGQLFNI